MIKRWRWWVLLAGLMSGMAPATPGLAVDIPATEAQGTVIAGVEMGRFVKPGNHFSVDLPRQWPNFVNARDEERDKFYAVYLKGPEPQKGAPVNISIWYYAPGNRIFKNEEDFVLRNAFPSRILPSKREKFGPIRKITVAGREARAFNRDTFEYYPPKSLNIKEIPVKEEIVVVPAAAGGFYVLHYEAPTAVYDRYAPVFERVLESFQPGH